MPESAKQTYLPVRHPTTHEPNEFRDCMSKNLWVLVVLGIAIVVAIPIVVILIIYFSLLNTRPL